MAAFPSHHHLLCVPRNVFQEHMMHDCSECWRALGIQIRRLSVATCKQIWSFLSKSVYHRPVITPTCSHYHSSISLKEIVAVASRFMFCWWGMIETMMMLHSKGCFVCLFLIGKLHQKFNPDRRLMLQSSKTLRSSTVSFLGKALIFHGDSFCKAQDEQWTQVVSSSVWERGTAYWSPLPRLLVYSERGREVVWEVKAAWLNWLILVCQISASGSISCWA